LFGLEPVFALNADSLDSAYRDIQAKVHPDRFAHAGDAERRASLQWTTRVNEAYRTLIEGDGGKKIQVIKVVRELTGLGLKEAKDLVDSAPKPLLEKVAKEAAEEAKTKLEAAGATVTVK